MALGVRIKPRAQWEIERAAEWWAENRPAALGAVRKDIEAALALLVEEPGIGTKLKQLAPMLFAACTSPEFGTSSTIECEAISSRLSHSGTLAAKLVRRSDPMTPNPSFQRALSDKTAQRQ